jgi:hypothetical protein
MASLKDKLQTRNQDTELNGIWLMELNLDY